jgi:hypothetical protein
MFDDLQQQIWLRQKITFISSTKEGKPPMDINVRNPAM